jgi:hypothetical protein
VSVRLPLIAVAASSSNHEVANPETRTEATMAKRTRPAPKSKILIRKNSNPQLTAQYAELVHLRKAVHQAELEAGVSKTGLRSN